MKKWLLLVVCFGVMLGGSGCGGAAEPAADETPAEVQEESAEEPAEEVADGDTDEELTEDINAWFTELYGNEYGPEWYADVTDIRIVTLEEDTILAIESTNTDESVASSMGMLIWGYDDELINKVRVYDQDGNLLFDMDK